MTSFLTAQGPSLSLATLKAEYPDVARAELASLRGNYCTWWRATHTVERCELDWRCPGSVWALDFSHPPHRIDGCFRAIFNVLDLASHQQLLWLAVDREDAATVIDALADLFEEHGAPLVLKCDNGPAFIARLTKGFLGEWSVFPLYSPPYCPRYNGGCERANRTLKELTAHRAESAGRAGFWTSDDLLDCASACKPAETAVGGGGWNARGNLDDSAANLTGQTRKHVATLAERDRGRSRPTWDRPNGHATALHSNRDRAHRGTTGAGSARSPSRDEEANCSGDLTPRNGKNYGGGTIVRRAEIQ